MNTPKENNKKLEWGYWIAIFIIIAMPIISIGDNLGLYFDSVFPDYAATQLLDSQQYETKWFVAWPILTQFYHGSLSMMISALVIVISGTTSIIQHRLTNAGILVICYYILNKILEKKGISRSIRHTLIVGFSFMPTMLGFCLTQYYIELPGVALTLMAFLLLIEDKEISNSKIWIAFLLLGIAFYSYFNFLFFFPGFLIVVLWHQKDKLEKFTVACLGMIPGGSLYIIGYLKAFYNFNDNFLSIFIGYVIVLFLFELIMYWFILNGKAKTCLMVYGTLILVALAGCLLLKDKLISIAYSTNLAGKNATLIERLETLRQYVYFALSGVSAELLMFGYQVTTYAQLSLIIWEVSTVIYVLLMCISKSFRIMTNAWKSLLIVLIYMLCCVPLVTRMQTQHFVPLCFLILITTVIEIHDMICYVSGKWSLNIKYFAIAVILSIITITSLYAKDRFQVIDEIFETGGNGYYTSQINKLAEQALQNQKMGKKEIYLFPEWGFMSGFNYITNNNIAFSTDTSEENFERLLQDGYNLEILYWNNQNAYKYMQKLKNMNEQNISQYEYIGNEGTIDFYRIEVKN